MNTIDLHVHSYFSDGTVSPTELVQLACSSGLTAFALTDHDTTDGLSEALPAAAAAGIEVLPGIEFSTEYLGKDIHIVGLEPDWTHPDFQAKVQEYREERFLRNQRIIDRMAADGIDISYEKMCAEFSGTTWTRAHYARYLADHGYVKDMWSAFETHLGEGCPYYIPRKKISPMEAVRILRQFHGTPILAHPLQYKFTEEELCTLLDLLCEAGLIGMEVYYSTYDPQQTEYLRALAERYHLLPSGGSDFHGSNKPDISLGTGKDNLAIPYDLLTALRGRLAAEESHE